MAIGFLSLRREPDGGRDDPTGHVILLQSEGESRIRIYMHLSRKTCQERATKFTDYQ